MIHTVSNNKRSSSSRPQGVKIARLRYNLKDFKGHASRDRGQQVKDVFAYDREQDEIAKCASFSHETSFANPFTLSACAVFVGF